MESIGATEPDQKILPGANSVGPIIAANSGNSGVLSRTSMNGPVSRRKQPAPTSGLFAGNITPLKRSVSIDEPCSLSSLTPKSTS